MLCLENYSQVKFISQSFSDILRDCSGMNSHQDQSEVVNMLLWLCKRIHWKMMAISATRGMTAVTTATSQHLQSQSMDVTLQPQTSEQENKYPGLFTPHSRGARCSARVGMIHSTVSGQPKGKPSANFSS